MSRLIRGPQIVYPPRYSSDGGSSVEFAIGLCLFSSYYHYKPTLGTSSAMIPCSCFTEVSRLIRGPRIVYPLRFFSGGGSSEELSIGFVSCNITAHIYTGVRDTCKVLRHSDSTKRVFRRNPNSWSASLTFFERRLTGGL